MHNIRSNNLHFLFNISLKCTVQLCVKDWIRRSIRMKEIKNGCVFKKTEPDYLF